MLGFLTLGFLIGLRHSLEADHVAAVTSLVARGATLREHLAQGALWGAGHTLALLALAGTCSALGLEIPAGAARVLEAGVGVMLVALGASVFLALRRGLERRSGPAPRGRRALAVGALHGLAGSAALVLLIAQASRSPAAALACILVFGVGSIAGMVALAAAVSLPLRAAARRGSRLYPLLCGGAGAFSLLTGAVLLWSVALAP